MFVITKPCISLKVQIHPKSKLFTVLTLVGGGGGGGGVEWGRGLHEIIPPISEDLGLCSNLDSSMPEMFAERFL